MDGLRSLVEIFLLLLCDVRGELVVNDCHWVVMWACICSVDCSYLG